jgi:tetratricopeptide (TPR) repeat protein
MPTIESSDHRLAGALVRLAAAPSAESERTVATEYFRVGVLDAAMEHYSAAVSLNPRDAPSYDMRARIWRTWGFPHLGLPDAHRAAYFAPLAPSAQNTLGTIFHRLGQFADARRHYERALALDPKAAYAVSNLCALDVDEGRPEAAFTSCRLALELAPNSLTAQRNLEKAMSLAAPASGGAHDQ